MKNGRPKAYDYIINTEMKLIRDVRAEIALQLPRTKLCCVLLGKAPLHQSRIVAKRNARSARTPPPTGRWQEYLNARNRNVKGAA